MFNIIKNLRLIFIFLFTTALYGGIAIFSKSNFCVYRDKDIKSCNLARIITYPSNFLVEGYEQSKRIVEYDGITSGLIVKNHRETINRFKNENLSNGFTFNYEPNTRSEAGFLLLSYANPIKNGHPEVELWDLNKQKKLHTYKIDIKKIAKKSRHQK